MFDKLLLLIHKRLGFSVRESQGFIVIMMICVLFLIVPVCVNYLLKPSKAIPIEIQLLDKQILGSESKNKYTHSNFNQAEDAPIAYFYFDPNTASVVDLKNLGLNKFAIQNIEKYRAKGWKYNTAEMFLKTYGLNDAQKKQLIHYIKIGSNEQNKPNKVKAIATKISLININTADSTSLLPIEGIGNKLATRIIKYRNKLGGFVSLNQLKEVYGIDSTTFLELNKSIYLSDDFVPIKISLKNVSADQLEHHPYLNKKEAKIIYYYLSNHIITSLSQLYEIKEVSKNTIDKMMPYLEI